ncbi:hypothetical protein SFRURICE_017280 [Spodoptera frugiperda]|nr:hypothetical protein SFRURICE_017280 [Spodoptera frugiperda]
MNFIAKCVEYGFVYHCTRLCNGIKNIFSHTHHTQTWNNNLWITQRVVTCGNRIRDTLHSSQLPSHRANCAVKLKQSKQCIIKSNQNIFIKSLPSLSQLQLPDKGSRVRFSGRESIAAFLSVFRKKSVVVRSLESCPVYGISITPYYLELITQMVKSGCTLAALHASAYPFGDKRPITQMTYYTNGENGNTESGNVPGVWQ